MGDFSKDINSSFPSLNVKAMLNIVYTANWITSKQNDFFKPYGISPQQYNVLRILKGAKEPIKVQTVKERMIERAPNVTRLMDKLIAKSLITRFNCEHDRRVVYVEITTKGLGLVSKIAENTTVNIMDGLSVKEAAQLSDLLDKIRTD